MIIEVDEKVLHKQLNQNILASKDNEITINGCMGQSFIGAGMNNKSITINGIPGNALGAYLNGADITVNGNAQDQTGDTMNEGEIIIHGSSGDATGYAMRGGVIYIRDNVGYRAGIHMKAYEEKLPVLVVGGAAGSFLGEYQAGGLIIVLGVNKPENQPLLGYFCSTGMHGGKMYLRCDEEPQNLPKQVMCKKAEDLSEIKPFLSRFCKLFGTDEKMLLNSNYYVLTPNSNNPYKRLYTQN